MPQARVLITVKTYPNPSPKYDELVCNAGFLESGEWVRIYPIKFRALPYEQQYSKYSWIELDLVRRSQDLRLESYSPKRGIDEEIKTVRQVSTGKKQDWRERKRYACREVFTSMTELIVLAKTANVWKSLATVKPKEIVKFEVEADERDWKPQIRDSLRQMSLFGSPSSQGRELNVVQKLPYKYYYHFLTEGDNHPRRMMIEDWEIGALYWNCLAQTEGDEVAANNLVRQKYEEEFSNKDLHLFVGTTLANHIRAPNPFVIIGVFYPPVIQQLGFDF
ncbi:MAG: hypothetical protein IPM39_24820 [Chloroflexi bacterium]|nr:hypothetical protein [Chloroflexota bacterium]